MKATRAILFGAIAMIAAGCYGDPAKQTVAPTLQVAYTRFVNAVNDTGSLDFRFVDQINNSPIGLALPYRGYTLYQATDPTSSGKARLLRAYFDSINVGQAVTTQTVQVGADESLTLTAGQYYTIVLLGPSRSAAPKWVVIQDNTTAFDTTWKSIVPDTTGIAARIVNLTAADGAGETVSLFMAKDTVFATNNAAFPSLAATAPLTASGALAYTKITLGGVGGATGTTFDTSIVKFARVTGTPATAGTLYTQSALGSYYLAVPVGQPASKIDDLTAIGGVIQGGTAMSIYVFPPVPSLPTPSTGSQTFSATATGYNRTVGSFVVDGFTVGMIVSASGFTNAANNGASVVTAVTATDLTVTKVTGVVAEAAAAGRTILTPAAAPPCSGTIAGGAAPGCSKSSTGSFRNYAVIFVIDHHPTPTF